MSASFQLRIFCFPRNKEIYLFYRFYRFVNLYDFDFDLYFFVYLCLSELQDNIIDRVIATPIVCLSLFEAIYAMLSSIRVKIVFRNIKIIR